MGSVLNHSCLETCLDFAWNGREIDQDYHHRSHQRSLDSIQMTWMRGKRLEGWGWTRLPLNIVINIIIIRLWHRRYFRWRRLHDFYSAGHFSILTILTKVTSIPTSTGIHGPMSPPDPPASPLISPLPRFPSPLPPLTQAPRHFVLSISPIQTPLRRGWSWR